MFDPFVFLSQPELNIFSLPGWSGSVIVSVQLGSSLSNQLCFSSNSTSMGYQSPTITSTSITGLPFINGPVCSFPAPVPSFILMVFLLLKLSSADQFPAFNINLFVLSSVSCDALPASLGAPLASSSLQWYNQQPLTPTIQVLDGEFFIDSGGSTYLGAGVVCSLSFFL